MINLQNLDIAHFKLWDVEKYFTADELFHFLDTIGMYEDYDEVHSVPPVPLTLYEYVYYYHLDDLVKYVHSFDEWNYYGEG